MVIGKSMKANVEGSRKRSKHREELKEILKQKAVKRGSFVLSSGKKSNYYIDLKLAYTEKGILGKIAEELDFLIDEHCINAEKLAGIELGAVAIVAALSMLRNMPFVIVRKERKEHGTKERLVGSLSKGENVLIIEDVATTGNSILSCAEALREKGAVIKHAISVIDRREGAEENLRKFNIELLSLFKVNELLR